MAHASDAHPDEAMHKGAVEDDSPTLDGRHPTRHAALTGQLGHRDHDERIKGNDTDFPEPDAEAEHSGS
ncbi:MAG: hypothetical protein KGK08_11600 [Acidobacteriota bacterium]|nr:hypothetical protein [Acidobacteriota bacterium]